MAIYLPPELIELIDEHRGPVPRNRYVSDLLAAHYGIVSPARRPGRPYKAPDPHDESLRIINIIARDDDEYRKAWDKRVCAAADALEALGQTIDHDTRERLINEQRRAFPRYHPPGSY